MGREKKSHISLSTGSPGRPSIPILLFTVIKIDVLLNQRAEIDSETRGTGETCEKRLLKSIFSPDLPSCNTSYRQMTAHLLRYQMFILLFDG